MDWNKIGLILVAGFILFMLWRTHKSGGLAALMEKSRNAPQHWGTFAALMAGVLLLVYLLIKL